MKTTILNTFLFVLISIQGLALDLSGWVIDSETEKPVPFATIQFIDLNTGIACDENGKFNFTGNLPQNTKLKISAVGYETKLITIKTPIQEITFYLDPSHIELEEFVIVTGGVLQKNSITNVEKRTIEELSLVQPNDLGEAIANIPSVYNLSTGTGISKPVIRGLSGMRVVTYMNGLRIENQQWGGDHGMGISDNGLGTVEIIKGPSALLFGVDALGGVMYLSEEAFANQNSIETYYSSKFESNSMKINNAAGFKISGKQLKLNLFANQTSAADYQLPNGKYLYNSRYQQKDIKTSLGYHYKNWIMAARYNYVQNQIGIPGETEDANFTVDDFLSNSTQRNRISPSQQITNHLALLENGLYFKRSTLNLKLGLTSNQLQEFEENLNTSALNMYLRNYTYTLFWNRKFNENHEVIVGSQGMFQNVTNHHDAEETLIPNSQMNDLGGYVVFQGNVNKWNYQLGGRYDQRNLSTSISKTELFDKTYQGLNYSGGINKTFKKFTFRTSISRGFRPPHTSEMFVDGPHHGTFRYLMGDVSLKSEKATQFDISAEYSGEHLYLSVNPYINQIKDYTYLQPLDTIIEGYPGYAYSQDPMASLMGGDLSIHYHPHFAHKLHIENNISYIKATRSDGSSLPLIPQTRSNTQVKYEFKTKGLFSLDYVAIQHLLFLGKNDVSELETKSSGYNLFNLAMSITVKTKLPINLQAGVKNILNEPYINHLSRLKPLGISGPGRNFYISLKIKFQS